MHKHPLFISWTLILVTIATLHIFALKFSLYWVFWWFDIPVHFLGGVFVALFALWFFFESGYVQLSRSIKHVALVAGGSIILVGISWEIFELFAGVPIEENFVLDTAIDLTMDALGAIVSGFIFVKIYLKESVESGVIVEEQSDTQRRDSEELDRINKAYTKDRGQ